MQTRTRWMRLVVVWLCCGLTAAGHHGVANFDLNSEIRITGTVTSVAFVNPHSWLHLDVTGASGRVESWRCELRGAAVLRRSGWSPEMFRPGTPVTVRTSRVAGRRITSPSGLMRKSIWSPV